MDWSKFKEHLKFSQVRPVYRFLVLLLLLIVGSGLFFFSLGGQKFNSYLLAQLSAILPAPPVVAVIRDPDATQPDYYKTNLPQYSLVKGEAPFPVFLEGWQSSPRSEIAEYEWNFGDSNAYNNNPNILKTFNGAHVYEKPGTYRATLTVKNKRGDANSTSVTIQVLPRTGKIYYVDSRVGADTNNGLCQVSDGSGCGPWKTATKAFEGAQNVIYQRGDSVLFKRGQTFEISAGFTPGKKMSAGYMFGTYGEGPKPVIQYTGKTSTAFLKLYEKGAHIAFVDLVFKMLSPNLTSDGKPAQAALLNALGGDRNLLLLRVEGYDTYSDFFSFNGSSDQSPYPVGMFFIDSKIANSPETAAYSAIQLYGRARRVAVIGSSFDLSGNHIAYLSFLDKAVIANNVFSRPAFGRTALRIDGGTFQDPSNNIHISGNKFLGWRDNLDNLGTGRAGGSHTGGGRYNYSLVEIAQNTIFVPPFYPTSYNKSSLGDGVFGQNNNSVMPNLDGAGPYAGRKMAIKVVSLSPAANQATFALYTAADSAGTLGQLVETKTVPSGDNVRKYFTGLANNLSVGKIVLSGGQNIVQVYGNPSLQSINDVIFENNILTNAERLLSVAVADNVIIRNNLFISPSTIAQDRIQFGNIWEWRPLRNVQFVGNTIITKGDSANGPAVIGIMSPNLRWRDFYFDSSNPFGEKHQNLVFKGNIIQVDPGTNSGKAKFVRLDDPSLLSAVMFDNNLYYSPNNTNNLFQIGANSYSFASWQSLGAVSTSTPARDANSVVGNPNLVNAKTIDDVAGGPTSLDLAVSQALNYISNLHLQRSSLLAFNRLPSLGSLLRFDFDGRWRPNNVSDLGAFQLSSEDVLPPDTVINPVAGSYDNKQILTFTVSEPATTYYCFGSGCLPGSTYLASTTISVASSSIVRYFSVDDAGNAESVKEASYLIKAQAATSTPATTTPANIPTNNRQTTNPTSSPVINTVQTTSKKTVKLYVPTINEQPGLSGPILSVNMDVVGEGGTTCLANGCPATTGGKFGGALSFNGSSTYLKIEDNSALNPTEAITISVWINPVDWKGNRRILQKSLNDSQYRLTAQSGQLIFELIGLNNYRLSANLPATGLWHHLAGTYDGSAISLYIDGNKVAGGPSYGKIKTGNSPLYIGTKTDTSVASDHFNGLIDNLSIYNRALQVGEIKALAGVAGADITPPVTAVSKPGGTYDQGTEIVLTPNEPAVVYYCVTSSLLACTPASSNSGSVRFNLTTAATVLFYSVDTTGNKENLQYVQYQLK